MKIYPVAALCGALILVGCGPSPTLASRSDEEIARCQRSLTFRDTQIAQARAQRTAFIPVVGSVMAREALYKAYEQICVEKGVLK